MTFYIEIGTTRSEQELMAECPACGAMTFIPLAYAWLAGSVSCCDCGTKMPTVRDDVMKLKAQAAGAVEEIERLLQLP
jgi:hypothetical protein